MTNRVAAQLVIRQISVSNAFDKGIEEPASPGGLIICVNCQSLKTKMSPSLLEYVVLLSFY